MKRICFILIFLFHGMVFAQTQKPNVVWIMLEDWGHQLSCYGEKGIHTPNIDKFASQGIRYTNSFCTAPVCSPSRSAMMTGFYQNYIHAHQHRTKGEGFKKKALPHGIKPITHLLEEAGYHVCLMASPKLDCNFLTDRPIARKGDWKERKKDQPFFAQLTFAGSHRIWKRDPIRPISIKDVKLPPYYPDTPLARRDWANGLEAMQIVDRKVGEVLERLDREGLTDNTLVFIIGDNGRCMPRGKQFLFDGGIQVPVLVRWPGRVKPKQVCEDLVMTIDITATILNATGIKPVHPLHGKNLFGEEVKQRKYVFAARDKMDSTHDAMRAIRSKEYKLIHNLMPERAYCQVNRYKEANYPVLALLNVLNLKGELPPEQAAFMASKKPEFELYDLKQDPYELKNLADSPAYGEVKQELLKELNAWRKRVNDKGVSESFRKGGWPADYPTKSLKEWEAVLKAFEKWVFRKPGSRMKHPVRRKK